MDRLQWMSQLKRDPVHRKIVKTRDAFVAKGEFDPDEALTNISPTKMMMMKTTLACLMD